MWPSLAQLWPWGIQTFGPLWTLLLLVVVLLLCLAWLWTPVGVWLLYRKSRRIEHAVLELLSRTTAPERLQPGAGVPRDRPHHKRRRRR
jgi:membrane-bound metal-dependent hydrolase YbcI (DUF457 family)